MLFGVRFLRNLPISNEGVIYMNKLDFYSVLGKTKKSIEKSQENIKSELDRVDSLDYFLSEEEVNKKY